MDDKAMRNRRKTTASGAVGINAARTRKMFAGMCVKTIVSISPNKVRFRVEQLRQRAVSIRPFLVGDPPAGYIIGEATAEPSLALVSGPASQVMKLNEVATERIIMTGRTSTFVQPAAVVSDSPLVRVISPQTTQVTVPVLAEVGPVAPATTGTTTTSTTSTQ